MILTVGNRNIYLSCKKTSSVFGFSFDEYRKKRKMYVRYSFGTLEMKVLYKT